MKSFLQHGQISTYDHCVCVARMSFLLNRRFALGADEESMVRGAFLHDFYLYDWHDCTQRAGRWHGFRHPAIALANAERLYPLNAKERDIIRSHMWPLTFLHWPHSREALLVCLADKICSTRETLLCRRVTVRPAGF
ncbi:MAG: HD family phosphohydrolase [Eubacteriales bacterium]|nr:HD family phosphohydrolase [Eubacteriales bacterium]